MIKYLMLLFLLFSVANSQDNDSLFVPESVKEVIKLYEGWRSEPYKEVDGSYAIGYGFSGKQGMKLTKKEGNKLFDKKISKIEKKVKAKIKVKLTQGQFSVLVDMIYNIGSKKIFRSTLVKLLNQGKYDLAGLQIKRWVKAKGQTLRGLVRRRNWNYELWVQNNDTTNKIQNINTADDGTDCFSRLFPCFQAAGKTNCVYGFRSHGHNGYLYDRTFKAGHCYRQSENYLSGNPRSSFALRYGLQRGTAIHSRSRYCCERYVSTQI